MLARFSRQEPDRAIACQPTLPPGVPKEAATAGNRIREEESPGGVNKAERQLAVELDGRPAKRETPFRLEIVSRIKELAGKGRIWPRYYDPLAEQPAQTGRGRFPGQTKGKRGSQTTRSSKLSPD